MGRPAPALCQSGAKARLPPLGRMFWESFEKVSPITWALSSRHQAVHVDERDVHSPELHRESSPCVRILAAARLFLLPGHRGGGVETYAETEESAGCEPLQATGGLPQGQVSRRPAHKPEVRAAAGHRCVASGGALGTSGDLVALPSSVPHPRQGGAGRCLWRLRAGFSPGMAGPWDTGPQSQ